MKKIDSIIYNPSVRGETGAKGDQGDKGATGFTGPTGAQGDSTIATAAAVAAAAEAGARDHGPRVMWWAGGRMGFGKGGQAQTGLGWLQGVPARKGVCASALCPRSRAAG
jgi:hypothetical protein